MKKILLFISVLGLVGCSTYTGKNNSAEIVKFGDTVAAPGACVNLPDSWLSSDFPLKITKDGTDLAKDTEYDAAHYVVNADNTVTKAEEACEEEEDAPPADAPPADAPPAAADAPPAAADAPPADADAPPAAADAPPADAPPADAPPADAPPAEGTPAEGAPADEVIVDELPFYGEDE